MLSVWRNRSLTFKIVRFKKKTLYYPRFENAYFMRFQIAIV
jgi:hypothetical protein